MTRRNRSLSNLRDGGKDASGSAPDALRRAIYEEILSGRLDDDGGIRRTGWKALALPTFLMILVAGVILGGAFIVSLWQKGRFDHLFHVREPASRTESVWQRQDRARPPEDLQPSVSQVDPLPPPPAEEPVDSPEPEGQTG
jgi:hypothetical protein